MIKQNESLYLQNKVNCEDTMLNIERRFGPFSKDELNLYMDRLMQDENGNPYINTFTYQLVSVLFYKFFRDVQSIRAINKKQYAELIISAKRILLNNNMIILPYIISGKVEKMVQRKNVNKKEIQIIQASPSYNSVIQRYCSPAIEQHIISIIATIISSEFTIVDPDPNIDGKKVDIVVPIIAEEVLLFIKMC